MTQPVWKLLATLLAICNSSYVSGIDGNWLCCRHTCFTTSSRHSIHSTHKTCTVDVNRLIKGCISLKVSCNSCCALQVPMDHHCVQYHIYSGSVCLVAVLSGGARPAGPLQPSPQVCAGQVCHFHDLLAGEPCCIAQCFHAVLCMSTCQAEIMLWTTGKHTGCRLTHCCCQHHNLKQKKLVWLCISTQLNVRAGAAGHA